MLIRVKRKRFKIDRHLLHLTVIQLVPVMVKQKVLRWLDWMWAYQMASDDIRKEKKKKLEEVEHIIHRRVIL